MSGFGRATVIILGFLLGFDFALIALCGFNVVYRGIWLPVGLAGLLGYCFRLIPRMREGGLAGRAAITFGLGATALWMSTTHMLPVSRGAAITRLLLPTFGLLAVFIAVLFWLAIKRLPSPERPAIDWLLAFMTLGWLVAFFSSGAGGADPMEAWVRATLHLGPEQAHALVVAARKTIHVSFYALAGWCAWNLAKRSGSDLSQATWFATLAPLAIASFDELRQSSIAGRTGSAWDVLLDMVGVGVVVLLVRLQRRAGAASAP